MTLTVHPIGSEVVFGGLPAKVTGINIRGAKSDHVTYELVWWANGSRNCQWVEAVEIQPPKPTLEIGFTAETDDIETRILERQRETLDALEHGTRRTNGKI